MSLLGFVLPLLAVNAPPAAVDRKLEPAFERDVDRLGWYVPDFAKLQTGGYVGSVAAGLGYAAFEDILNVTALYGYTPAAVAGDPVSSIELKLSLRPFDLAARPFRFVPIYAGAGALFTWGEGYYQVLPERYESGYYPPTGRHFTLHLGAEADWAPASPTGVERHGIYLEVVALDVFLGRYLRNPETLGPEDALTMALGYRVAF